MQRLDNENSENRVEFEIGAGFKSTAKRSTKWLDMENMEECEKELSRRASVEINNELTQL